MSHPPCLLMTGGTGFVGRRLAPLLAPLFPDHRRVMLVRATSRAVQPSWESTTVDLTDEAAVGAVVAQLRPEIVVHLAAQWSVARAADGAAQATWGVNVVGTFHLAAAVARYDQTRLVFFSSTGEVYGASCLSGPVDEESPAAPTNAYGRSKLAAERLLEDVLPPSTRLIVTRAFNHSGPGQDERFVLPSFAGQIVRAEQGRGPPTLSVGNLQAERDFLHVEDVVRAYAELIAIAETLSSRTVVNVCSGQAQKMATLLDKLVARARIPVAVVADRSRMRSSEIPRVVGDSSRLRGLTGWEPRRHIDNLLYDIVEHFRQQIHDEP